MPPTRKHNKAVCKNGGWVLDRKSGGIRHDKRVVCMKQEYPYFGRKYGPKDAVRSCRTCGEDFWVPGFLTACGYQNEEKERQKFEKRFEQVQPQVVSQQEPVAQAPVAQEAVVNEPPAYVAAEEAPVSAYVHDTESEHSGYESSDGSSSEYLSDAEYESDARSESLGPHDSPRDNMSFEERQHFVHS